MTTTSTSLSAEPWEVTVEVTWDNDSTRRRLPWPLRGWRRRRSRHPAAAKLTLDCGEISCAGGDPTDPHSIARYLEDLYATRIDNLLITD